VLHLIWGSLCSWSMCFSGSPTISSIPTLQRIQFKCFNSLKNQQLNNNYQNSLSPVIALIQCTNKNLIFIKKPTQIKSY